MKKLVILLILLLVIIAGVWYWTRPAKDVASITESACSDDVKNLILLLKAVQGDERSCGSLEGDFNAYCLAYFGKDDCSSLLNESQKSCFAILNKNANECDEDSCYGILGNVDGCSSPSCVALAKRDSASLNADEICKPYIERAVRNAECFDKARTPEETEVCINQSSLTV